MSAGRRARADDQRAGAGVANEPGRESHDVTKLRESERAVGQRLQDQLAVACGEGDETAPGLVRAYSSVAAVAL